MYFKRYHVTKDLRYFLTNQRSNGFKYVITIITRAVANIKNELSKRADYDISEWTVDS